MRAMRISAGCQITYDCSQPTPMLLMLSLNTVQFEQQSV
jgi:hypothetical protein